MMFVTQLITVSSQLWSLLLPLPYWYTSINYKVEDELIKVNFRSGDLIGDLNMNIQSRSHVWSCDQKETHGVYNISTKSQSTSNNHMFNQDNSRQKPLGMWESLPFSRHRLRSRSNCLSASVFISDLSSWLKRNISKCHHLLMANWK